MVFGRKQRRRKEKSSRNPKVEALLKGLQSSSAKSKRKAIGKLGTLGSGDEQAIPALIDLLSDRTETVRRNAIRALGKIGPQASAALDILIASLAESDSKTRDISAEAILRVEPKAEALIQALEHPDAKTRDGAKEALLKISAEHKTAVPTLVHALGNADKDVKQAVSEALGRIGSPAVDSLIAAMKERKLRPDALATLSTIGAKAKKALTAIGKVSRSKDLDTALAGVEALRRIGAAATPFLVDALSHSAIPVRRRAAEALGSMGEKAKASLPALLEALKDEATAEGAAYALCQIGPTEQRAIPPLIEVLKREGQSYDAILFALGKIGSANIATLTDALGHPEAPVREGVARVLADIGPDAASTMPALVAVLGDESLRVRYRAARAIWRVAPSTKEGADVLVKSLGDPREGVHDVVRDVLAESGPDTIPVLIGALGNGNPPIASSATDLLAEMGRPAVYPLIHALEQKGRVRDNAAKALRSIAGSIAMVRIPRPGGEETIDLRDLTGDRLRDLSEKSPKLLYQLYRAGRRRDPGSILHAVEPPPPPLPEMEIQVKGFIDRSLALRDQVERALANAVTKGSTEKAPPSPAGSTREPQRFTDLTIYRGHVYSADLPEANQLDDEIPLEGGQQYTLGVTIRSKRIGIDAKKDAPGGVKNPRHDQETLTVYVRASPMWPGVEIRESLARIRWPYNSDSDSALFWLDVRSVRAHDTSQGMIEVRLYDGSLDLLDLVEVLITVVHSAPADKGIPGIPPRRLSWADKKPGTPHIDPASSSRLLSIHVTRIRVSLPRTVWGCR